MDANKIKQEHPETCTIQLILNYICITCTRPIGDADVVSWLLFNRAHAKNTIGMYASQCGSWNRNNKHLSGRANTNFAPLMNHNESYRSIPLDLVQSLRAAFEFP